MPPQKKQRARTNGKSASKAVSSRKTAARRSNGETGKRAAKKERRPSQRKQAKDQQDEQAKAQPLRVTLPGEMYEEAGQWWWQTQLPGEDKAKARPLSLPEWGEALCDRETAEKSAIEMWEQAAAKQGARQITLDSTAKVERLKAQFLDKIRQLTEIVETANRKAEAEVQARTEIEARLNAMIQAQSAAAPAIELSAPAQPQPPVVPSDIMPDAAEPAEPIPPTDTPEASVNAGPVTNDVAIIAPTEPRNVETKPPALPTAMETEHVVQTGTCDCCGSAEIPVSDLETIDSGQLLCSDCLAALRIDISRIEAKTFSDTRA